MMQLREVFQRYRSADAINHSLEPAILILNLGSEYGVYQVTSHPLHLTEIHISLDLDGVEAYLHHLQTAIPTFTLDPDAWISTG